MNGFEDWAVVSASVLPSLKRWLPVPLSIAGIVLLVVSMPPPPSIIPNHYASWATPSTVPPSLRFIKLLKTCTTYLTKSWCSTKEFACISDPPTKPRSTLKSSVSSAKSGRVHRISWPELPTQMNARCALDSKIKSQRPPQIWSEGISLLKSARTWPKSLLNTRHSLSERYLLHAFSAKFLNFSLATRKRIPTKCARC